MRPLLEQKAREICDALEAPIATQHGSPSTGGSFLAKSALESPYRTAPRKPR